MSKPFENVLLLGLIGKARCGKDSTAEEIGRWALRNGHQTACVGFGQLIRRELFQLCPGVVQPYHDDKEYWRPLLQLWAQARELGNPHHYTDQIEEFARNVPWEADKPRIFLIPGCRKEHEIGWLGGHNGHAIGVIRPDAPAVAPHHTEQSAERMALLCKWKIHNIGEGKFWKDSITRQVNQMMKEILEEHGK